MTKSQMLWKLGMVLVCAGIGLFAVRAVCAAIIVQHMNPIRPEQMDIAFGFQSPFFHIPTIACFVLGIVALVIAYIAAPGDKI